MPWALLQTVGDNQEASVVRSLLEAHQIRVVVQGEQHRAMLGMLGPYIELRILVEEADLERARRVLAEAEAAGPAALDELEGEPGALRGALCPVHEKEATATCSRCGTFLCGVCDPAPELPLCEECEALEATPDEARAHKRRVRAAVVFLLLFGVPLLVALLSRLT